MSYSATDRSPARWVDGSQEFTKRPKVEIAVDPASPGGDHMAICVYRTTPDGKKEILYAGPDRRVDDLGCDIYGHDWRRA